MTLFQVVQVRTYIYLRVISCRSWPVHNIIQFKIHINKVKFFRANELPIQEKLWEIKWIHKVEITVNWEELQLRKNLLSL